MTHKAAIFGAALDCLDGAERIGLKLAYLEALAAGRVPDSLPADPCDAIAPAIMEQCGESANLFGEVDVPGWLTPRPPLNERDKVTAEGYRRFMDEGGHQRIVSDCERMASEILPAVPVMIAVDHALAAGPIRAASRAFGAEAISVVVLDQHFDAVPAKARAESALGEQGAGLVLPAEGMCGDFLAGLIEDGAVLPEKLFVVGVSDRPPKHSGDPYSETYHSWIERGVRVYSRDEASSAGFESKLCKDLLSTGAGRLYLSVDADVGAIRAIGAARFIDRPGLGENRLMSIGRALSGLLADGKMSLAGLDLCEVETHFIGLMGPDGAPDRTAIVLASLAAEIIRPGRSHAAH